MDFEKYVNEYLNYFEQIDNTYSLVGIAELSLCYNIAHNDSIILAIDEYNGQDDNAYDWDVWNPDFLSSIVYSDGNPFEDKGNSNKRKEFWIWYLDVAYRLSFNSTYPILNIKTTDSQVTNEKFVRNQTYG